MIMSEVGVKVNPNNQLICWLAGCWLASFACEPIEGFLSFSFISCLIAFAEVRSLSGFENRRDDVSDYVIM